MTKTFSFSFVPKTVEELKSIPESALTDAFATAALTALVLINYENDPNDTVDLVNFLKGPQPLSPYDIQFLRDRLVGKYYVPRSYFKGSSPENNYEPAKPYEISVSDNSYSYDTENYAMLYITSSGADSPRSVKLRRKQDQWFLWENYLLPDIRKPKAEDPWA